jgi:hypothetical protein
MLVNNEGRWDLVDVKSVSPWAPSGGLPYVHHLPQIHAYYVLLQDEAEREELWDIGDAYLVYITRWQDDHVPDMYEYKVTPNEQEIDEVKALMTEFVLWSERDELPPRPYANPEEHPWSCVSYAYNKARKTKEWQIRCPYFLNCWGPNHLDEWGFYQAE